MTVLVWNLIGLKSSQPAGLVLGQSAFDTNISNNVARISELTLNAPFGVTGSGSQLIVSDQQNARLLLWAQLPQSRTDAPTTVWGQPDFGRGQRNTLSVSDGNLCAPAGIATDGTRLFVADPCNHRVLIWNSLPTSPAEKAAVVLGQPSFSSSGANVGGVSAHSLSGPLGVASDGQRLLVADTGNNRVLIWNTIPTQSGRDADLVLGQPSFTVSAAASLDSTSLAGPAAVLLAGDHVLVADTGADRVLIWNSVPTRSQAPADLVLGQTEFVNDQRLRPPDKRSLLNPYGLALYGSRLYVVDRGNHRVLYWNALPSQNNQAADGLIGQPSYADASADNAGDITHPQLTAQALSSPTSLFATTDALYIADQGNSRILVLPNPPLP